MKRRRFLRHLLTGAGVPLIGLNTSRALADAASCSRRLVLVELDGANDGLNTLVPYANDHYHALRPTLGLSTSDVVVLDDDSGMHHGLLPLMTCWERGELAWIQGLGYPAPNRSHFKSMALWETAGDGHHSRNSDGWLTHAVEHQLGRSVLDPHGISLAGDLSLFASESGRWLSARSIKDLVKRGPSVKASPVLADPRLAVLRQRMGALDDTMARIAGKLSTLERQSPLPAFGGGRFGEQLRQVCSMVAAGLDTPVYRVQLSGFDTHDNQKPRHGRLMDTLAQGLISFRSTLRALNEWDNTLVMTYSEFGRRAAENRSGGTDHGTAAPHMLLGGAVAGGLYGRAPELTRLLDGDPEFTMDYRALYHSVLTDGLGVKAGRHALQAYADERLQAIVRAS